MNRKAVTNLGLIVALLLLALLIPRETVEASTGGPETSGYVFIDSDKSGGPAYNLEDISSTGTTLTLADNASSAAIPLGFTFKFFGVDYTSLYIFSDGYVSFLSGTDSPTAAAIPSTNAPNAIIAGWWGDFKPNRGGTIAYKLEGSAPNRTFLVQYKDVPYSGLLSSKTAFEIKLFETSNAIEVHYSSAPVDGSNNNTAGIENETGQLGLQYYYGAEGLASSLAVRYTPFVGVALEPASIIGYGNAGESKVYDLSVYNWTGQADTFSLSASGYSWPTTFSDTSTGVLAQGAGFNFTLTVDFPPGAIAADYDAVDVQVVSGLNMPNSGDKWRDTTHIITAVPRMGYIFNQNEVDFVDTQFHQIVTDPLSTEDYGPFLQSGALSPDGTHLFGVLSGGQDDQGNVVSGKMLVWNVDDMSAPPEQVDIGMDAANIAVTADGKHALITSYGDGTLYVIDIDPASASYLTVENIVSVGSQPVMVATSPCLNKAYITNRQSNSVTVLDLSTWTVSATITGLSTPWGVVVAPKGDRAYVANAGKIGVIDTLTDTLTSNWNVNGSSLEGLDITPDGNRLYVAGSSNALVVNIPGGGTVAATIATSAQGIYDADVFPASAGPLAYLANGGGQSISVIDTDTNTQIYSIAMPGTSPSDLALFPPEIYLRLRPRRRHRAC